MLTLVLALTGCETGTEVAVVSRAVISKTGDTVVVDATLDCMVARGRPRGDGNCDADNSRVCVEARWFTAVTQQRTATAASVARGEVCDVVQKVRGSHFELRFQQLPADAETVLVFTTTQDQVKDEVARRGVQAAL